MIMVKYLNSYNGFHKAPSKKMPGLLTGLANRGGILSYNYRFGGHGTRVWRCT